MMANKIILYYQTFNSLNKILYQNTPITHIHLSAIHFGVNQDKTPYIHLNDYEPYNNCFNTVWQELEQAKKLGIKIILMVGGAGGAFQNLFSNFNVYYTLLKNLILNKKIITGIDLDIEEYVDINNVKNLIKRIRNDFGKDFIITMAPVQSSLQSDIIGMGGFVYKDLFKSDVGNMIDYFNGQFYMNYSEEAYTQAINNGYPPEKIIMGMISGEEYKNELIKTVQKYKDRFGGVFIWEYFNAPNEWWEEIKNIFSNLGKKDDKNMCLLS